MILIENMQIFGAFCSTAWSQRKQMKSLSYFGTGETFLFRFFPDKAEDGEGEFYAWVGIQGAPTHGQELFQAADNETLLVGGG